MLIFAHFLHQSMNVDVKALGHSSRRTLPTTLASCLPARQRTIRGRRTLAEAVATRGYGDALPLISFGREPAAALPWPRWTDFSMANIFLTAAHGIVLADIQSGDGRPSKLACASRASGSLPCSVARAKARWPSDRASTILPSTPFAIPRMR